MRESNWMSLTATAAAVLLLLSLFIRPFLEIYIAPEHAIIVQAIIANIAASFVFLLSTEIGRIAIIQRDKTRFRKFFGNLAKKPGASRLIFPEFSLSSSCEEKLTDIPHHHRFAKYMGDNPSQRFADIPNIVSSNDLRGLMIFTFGFGEFSHTMPQPVSDELAVKALQEGPLNLSLVSFGLTSNSVTDLYLSIDDKPLFTLKDDTRHAENQAQNPEIIVGREAYGKDAQHQHGIILRFRPNPQTDPDQYWFICAGVAAVGTPAAAGLLMNEWRRYLKKFGQEDFLILFRVSNNMAGFSRQNVIGEFTRAQLEKDHGE